MSGPHTESPTVEPGYEEYTPPQPPSAPRPELEQHPPFSIESGTEIDWTAPLSSRPLIEHPVAAFLSELADAIADGGPAPYGLTWRPGRVAMQLEPNPEGNPRAALRWWAARLGVTSVRVVHNWTAGSDKYSVEAAFAGSRLEAWVPVERAELPGESTSSIPVDQLDRGFDDPPPYAGTDGAGID